MLAQDSDRTGRGRKAVEPIRRASDGPARQRKILHIDMDAFFASVEQRDNPELRGKPVAVGGSRERGVVAAASYEAREFGVHSAMPSVTAKRRCPDLIFVTPRFDVYKAVSLQIRKIFAEYTAIIEPLSLDEAYLDVTENLKGIASATEIAEDIRAKIRHETNLTASAGVSYNKFLAKLASDHRKPDGLFVITPKMGPALVENLPVAKFHGVGPATTAKMNRLGIETGLDLRAQTLPFLQQHFGKSGRTYYWIARGVDERPVRADRVRKSVGAESTFAQGLHAFEPMREALQPIIAKVWRQCQATGARGRTVTLKVKFADFQQITRSKSVGDAIDSLAGLECLSLVLLEPLLPTEKGVRLLGISLSSLTQAEAARARDEARADAAEKVSAVEASREAARMMSPVSIFISRKTQRLYVRQSFQPVLESPITIHDADHPIGTHIYTVFDYANDGADLRWSAISMDRRQLGPNGKSRRGDGPNAESMSPDVGPARAALDRIEIPQDIVDRISEIISPGSSLIISDEGMSTETGEDTDFVILMNGEPQGAIKMRRHDPDAHDRYDRQYDRSYGHSPAYAPSFDSGGPFVPW